MTVTQGRKIQILYYNVETRVIDSDIHLLEQRLKKIWDVSISGIQSLDEIQGQPCDLLIVAAQVLEASEFGKWLAGLSKRIGQQGGIWIPCLILSEVEFEPLRDTFDQTVKDNWYFDIIAPLHMDSLPIRIANLLRIHDHLHELNRYDSAFRI